MLKHLAYIAIAFLYLLISSCEYDIEKLQKRENIQQGEWTPEFAIPIVNSSLNAEDILSKANPDIVKAEANGLITLVYEADVFQLKGTDFIKPLGSQSGGFELNDLISIDIPSAPIDQTVSLPAQTQVIDFENEDSISITEIALNGGELKIITEANMPGLTEPSSFTLRIPSLSKDGNVVEINLIVDPQDPNPVTDITSLEGYSLDLTNGGTDINKLKVEVEGSIVIKKGDALFKTDGISINYSLSGLSFDYVRGDFRNQVIDVLQDSLNVGIFNKAKSEGDFKLAQPEIKFGIENGLGLPLDLDFSKMYSKNKSTGLKTSIFFGGSGSGVFSIAAPTVVGDSVSSEFVMDESNTNLQTVLEPTPKYLIYDIDAELNPGSSGVNNNFIAARSGLKLKTSLRLPLQGYLSELYIRDTIDFTFAEDDERFNYLVIRTIFDNGFPLEANLQLYLLDEANNKLDSLINTENKLMAGGIPDKTTGRVDQANKMQSISDIEFEYERLPNFLNAKKIAIVGTLNTSESDKQQEVSLYNDYELGFRVGIAASVKLNF